MTDYSIQQLQRYVRMILETLEDNVEDQIDELRSLPEYSDIDAFVAAKLDDDQYEFNYVELQALARNETQFELGDKRVGAASQAKTEKIRSILVNDYGFKFIGREKLKQTRGFTSPLNGKNRWAGQGGGGSGFSSGGLKMGGGSGTAGGSTNWDKNSSRNLGMGAGRKLFCQTTNVWCYLHRDWFVCLDERFTVLDIIFIDFITIKKIRCF